MVDGRLPHFVSDMSKFANKADLPAYEFQVGAHIGAPVILEDGRLYGALFAFSFSPLESVQEADLAKLKVVALMLAQHLKHSIN